MSATIATTAATAAPTMMQRFLQASTPLGTVKELLINSIRTGCVTGTGDVAAQIVESRMHHNKKLPEDQKVGYIDHLTAGRFKLDSLRLASVAAFGLFFFGPVGGAWYNKLEHIVSTKLPNAGKVKRVAAKVALEQLILAPPYTLAFFFFSQFAAENGFKWTEFRDKIKQDYIATLILDESAWLIASPILYGFVPVKNQLLVASCLSAAEAMAFSYIAFNSVERVPVIGPILHKLLSAHNVPADDAELVADKNTV